MKALSDARGCTAAEEFERLLSQGSGPNAIYHLPARLLRVVDGAIDDLNARHIAARWRIVYRFNGPMLDHSAARDDGADTETMPGSVLALLYLRGILQSVRDGIKAKTAAQRFEVYREVVRLFWLALVAPMVQSDGVSRAQSGKAAHLRKGATGNATSMDQVAEVRRLRKSGMSRANAVAKMMEFNGSRVSNRRASKLVADAGWPGRPGRVRS